MGLEVRIDGAATLKRVAAQMRAESHKDLSRGMAKALDRSTEPVKASIRREADAAMPRSGGYQAAFSRSLNFRLSRRTGGQRAQVILRTYADGTKERRDIKALERGVLRHPVYGRSRRVTSGPRAGSRDANPWAVTSIRGGFHKRGTDHAADEAQNALEHVITDYAQRLIK